MHDQPSGGRRGATTMRTPPLGRLYNVEERRLLLHQSGSGSPSVVFLPGAGLIGLDFLNVHDQVAGFTTSVLYDRAGTGWSDEVTLPRTAAEVAVELEVLLRAANVPAPYLLVGHSLGGAYARRFAQLFPAEVAGLLLLEPAHEDWYTYVPRRTALDNLRQVLAGLRVSVHYRAFYRAMFERMLCDWPESIREPLVEYHLRSLGKTLREQANLRGEVFDELRHGGPTPDVPLTVLVAMGIDPFMAAVTPVSVLRKLDAGKPGLYRALAASVPRGECRVVEDAGHTTIHTDRPDAVVQAIRDLVDREPARLKRLASILPPAAAV